MYLPPDESPAGSAAPHFAHVTNWVFDLDNTLYPARTNLFAQIDERIGRFIQGQLGVEAEAARGVQKDYYRRYGTTLRGLMEEHGIVADGFLDFVHDIDHSVVPADPALALALAALPGRRFVLTNGSRRHAEKTMERLGIADAFEDIFDIVAADLLPKPARATYERFLARHGVSPGSAAMFEDLSRNLEVPHALGMRTVLVVPDGPHADFREAWEQDGQTAGHVDFVTSDLAGFVASLVRHG
jgi:putative hydrolase of the HAD superfamily